MNHRDQYILNGIRAGNVVSFKALFDEYYPMLCHFAEKNGLDLDVAEDIVQDLFVKLWENRNSLTISSSIKSYLFQSTRNQCLNYLKRGEVKKKFEEYALHLHPNHDYNDAIEEEELSYFIYKAVESLPPKCQEVFRLSRFEEKSNEEISREMGISSKTVNNQIGKAVKIIRQFLIDNEILVFIFLMLIF